MKAIVGIDFGTSSTVIRYKTEGEGPDKIQSVKDKDKDIIPSVVYRRENGELLYGVRAFEQTRNRRNRGQCIPNIKLDLLNKDKEQEAKQLIKGFLRHTYSLFCAEIEGKGYTDFDIYVSYPVKWKPETAKFMIDAVKEAGYQGNIFGRNEAQAATRLLIDRNLLRLRREKIIFTNKPTHVMMLDMGAGTTDIVIFNLLLNEQGEVSLKDVFSYPSTDNPCLCGGSEIDEILSKYVNEYFDKNAQFKNESRRGTSHIDIQNAKSWKDDNLANTLLLDEASSLPETILEYLSDLVYNADSLEDNFLIDRSTFEVFTKSHWAKLNKLIESALCSYKKVKAEDIDLVFLTGGHSQWYVVPKLFNGEKICGINRNLNFSKLISEPQRIISKGARPQETVAYGLCMQDTNIDIQVSTPNNVWAEIIIEHNSQSFKSGITQIVKAGDILPTVPKHIDFDHTFEKNAVFANLTFGLTINIYTGEKLQTAQVSSLTVSQDQGGVIQRLLGILFVITIFIPLDYKYGCSVDLSLKEDGTLSIDGKLKLDTEEMPFSAADFTSK